MHQQFGAGAVLNATTTTAATTTKRKRDDTAFATEAVPLAATGGAALLSKAQRTATVPRAGAAALAATVVRPGALALAPPATATAAVMASPSQYLVGAAPVAPALAIAAAPAPASTSTAPAVTYPAAAQTHTTSVGPGYRAAAPTAGGAGAGGGAGARTGLAVTTTIQPVAVQPGGPPPSPIAPYDPAFPFNGTWKLDHESSDSMAPHLAALGVDHIAQQAADKLTITLTVHHDDKQCTVTKRSQLGTKTQRLAFGEPATEKATDGTDTTVRGWVCWDARGKFT